MRLSSPGNAFSAISGLICDNKLRTPPMGALRAGAQDMQDGPAGYMLDQLTTRSTHDAVGLLIHDARQNVIEAYLGLPQVTRDQQPFASRLMQRRRGVDHSLAAIAASAVLPPERAMERALTATSGANAPVMKRRWNGASSNGSPRNGPVGDPVSADPLDQVTMESCATLHPRAPVNPGGNPPRVPAGLFSITGPR